MAKKKRIAPISVRSAVALNGDDRKSQDRG
jgi:hypothetical protein